jgi:hypothetical protein
LLGTTLFDAGTIHDGWPAGLAGLRGVGDEGTPGVLTGMIHTSPQLQTELERHILARTGRRLRNLAIELDPEAVILRGSAATYYVKQLAQQGVREVLPQVRLENAIVVDSVN